MPKRKSKPLREEEEAKLAETGIAHLFIEDSNKKKRDLKELKDSYQAFRARRKKRILRRRKINRDTVINDDL